MGEFIHAPIDIEVMGVVENVLNLWIDKIPQSLYTSCFAAWLMFLVSKI